MTTTNPDTEALKRSAEELAQLLGVAQLVDMGMPRWHEWLIIPRSTIDDLPVRYRVARGGRGGAKSRTFARALLKMGQHKIERVLCAREFQRSIRDSVHRLLADEIDRLGLGALGSGFYTVSDKEIRGRNGTLFVFQGLHRNENGIKSLEGITKCWVEEARSMTQRSLDVLLPTIRQPGSEIWFSYNPYLPTDPVDKLFFGGPPPPGSVLIEVHHRDNWWFPDVLKTQMEYDRQRDTDKWAHIWEGKYLQHSETKVFRNWKVRRFDIPADAVLRNGADWGFSVDPTVIVQAFIGRWSGEPWESDPVADPKGRVLFVPWEAWEIGCPVDELPALFAGDDYKALPGQKRWQNPRRLSGIPEATRWKIIADSARPELIAYLQMRGFNIEGAAKGPGSLEDGIAFLQSFDICVHERCQHVIDELTHYSYKIDQLTDEVLPELADKDNHTIDALRYALENVRKAGTGRMDYASAKPRVTTTLDQEARLKRQVMDREPAPPVTTAGVIRVPRRHLGVMD